MRRLIILSVLLLFASTSFSDDLDTRIRKEAKKFAEAILDQDWDTVVNYTYPVFVESIGGKERMIKILQNGSNQMASQGISFKTIVIGDPLEKRRTKKNIYALVPQEITMKISGGFLNQKSYMIGISKVESGNWYFLDTAQLDEEKLKVLLPDLAGQMTIPEREPPVFESK